MTSGQDQNTPPANPFGPAYWWGDLHYCPKCRGNLTERLIESEDRPRLVCDSCQYILYINPKIVVGVIPIQQGQVVLLRRGIEPRRGHWTFPSGFMELGESVEGAAQREAKEETNLEVASLSLLNVYSRPAAGLVIVVFMAQVVGGEPKLGKETLEIASFSPEGIPWVELAFDTTRWALRDWLKPPR